MLSPPLCFLCDCVQKRERHLEMFNQPIDRTVVKSTVRFRTQRTPKRLDGFSKRNARFVQRNWVHIFGTRGRDSVSDLACLRQITGRDWGTVAVARAVSLL